MSRVFQSKRRRPHLGVALVVLGLHILLLVGLVRAFAPQFVTTVTRSVTTAFSLDLETVPKEPQQEPVASEPETGPAGPPARKAQPREMAAPRTAITLAPTQAPPVPSDGDADAVGADERGEGSGALGVGVGAGTGGAGNGHGGGAPTVKLSGNINSASDYPRKTRELRIGHSVTIDLRVGTDGRVQSCAVVKPSPDTVADRITCELASRRFVFRPATNAAGTPVEAVYRWRQRWFY